MMKMKNKADIKKAAEGILNNAVDVEFDTLDHPQIITHMWQINGEALKQMEASIHPIEFVAKDGEQITITLNW